MESMIGDSLGSRNIISAVDCAASDAPSTAMPQLAFFQRRCIIYSIPGHCSEMVTVL